MIARLRSLWRAFTRARQLDADMDDEMRFHVEMHAERLRREEQLDPAEARRRALVAFGGVEKFKEEGRDLRGWRWLDAAALDTRLGFRMLVKYRGLTLVGGFAMAVAIAIGATCFEAFSELLGTELPFAGGDRVVSVQYVKGPGSVEPRVLHEFVAWREELTSIEHLGAFRTAQHNLVTATGLPEPVKVAEITASGFALTQTPPHIGRYLLPDDDRADAASAVVIGYDVWQSRFGGAHTVVGATMHLGGVPRTIVGVMPQGFRFPVDHQYWIPLQVNPAVYQPLSSPPISMFGRLADGVTLEQAQSELTTVGQRTAAANANTHAMLRPIVMPYTREHLDLSDPMLVSLLRVAQALVGALTFVVAVNLAILFYARTVTRLGEIAVRTALGASRGRILAQLFTEALALSIVGAAIGLLLADVALSRMQTLAQINGSVPFWMQFELSLPTALYATALASIAALIMGVLPGVKATGRQLIVNLHEGNVRGGTRLGPIWTALVVGQVAAAVAVLPIAVYFAWQVVQLEFSGSGFADHRFVVATLALGDGDAPTPPGDIRNRQMELMLRLEAEPAVDAVTFSSSVPGFSGGRSIELETGMPKGDVGVLDISRIDVAVDLFAVYESQIVAGRTLNAGDANGGDGVIVNQSFANRFLRGRSPLGARFRYSRSRGPTPDTAGQPWHRIIGVVRDFPSFPPALSLDDNPTAYHAAVPGSIHPVVLSVRFAQAIPSGFPDRVRVIGAEVDQTMQLRRVVPLSTFYRDVRSFWRYLAWAMGLLTASVLLLSAAGIYALMSFTVAQRTREIGIRTALGAHPRRVLMGVFARVVRQLSLGVLSGSLISAAAFTAVGLDVLRAGALLLSVAAVMLIVGLLAALGPARRSLRIPASEALRADG